MRSLHRAALARLVLASGILACGLAVSSNGRAQSSNDPTSLANCPSRQPVLRVAGVFSGEEFSSHPVETRFASTHYSLLYLTPLFGADPWEEKVDPRYGVAESWSFLPGARGIDIALHKGLTFNNGDPITAKDVVFSFKLFSSKFADDQIAAALKGIDPKFEIIDDYHLRIDFAKGSITFPQEFSTLVFPLYVTSRAYHSGGEITQEAIDKFKATPLAAGPYRVASRQAQRGIVLEAARKDPLLGCPRYNRVEIRNQPEMGARMAQFRTGVLDIISGDRDLIDQAKSVGATVAEKPGSNMIGLYFFHTGVATNIFKDVRVRQAAAYAIDHKLLADTIWKGIGVMPWGCNWPPSTEISVADPDFIKACGTPYPFNPTKAKQLLEEAGLGSSNPPIRLVYWGNYPEESLLAEAIEPMLNAVGFDTTIEKIDRAEYARRSRNGGYANQIMFFGPGGRITSLSGSYFAFSGSVGPTQDRDLQAALARATGAETLKEYMSAVADIGHFAHDRAYAPGFFSASSIFFVRKGIPDWGLKRSVGRGPINLLPLVVDLKP